MEKSILIFEATSGQWRNLKGKFFLTGLAATKRLGIQTILIENDHFSEKKISVN
jgi:hypothetical protein